MKDPKIRWIPLVMMILVSGCATDTLPPIHPEAPIPTTEDGRKAACSSIRKDIERIRDLTKNPSELVRPYSGPSQTVEMDLGPLMQQRLKTQAAERIAQLEIRASTIGCYSTFSDRTAPTYKKLNHDSGFDECFSKCKQYTQRTNEQCFDACKR